MLMSRRNERRTTAALFVCVNTSITLMAALSLTGEVWRHPRFTFKHVRQPSTDLLHRVRPAHRAASSGRNDTVPDEYEACERIRFDSFVRAPCNAFSSLAFLSAPAYQLATNENLWDAKFQGLPGLAAGFGAVSIVLGTALAHASFLYHASATVEMNSIDVRVMVLFLIHNTLKCVYMSARAHLLHTRWDARTWRRYLLARGRPVFWYASTCTYPHLPMCALFLLLMRRSLTRDVVHSETTITAKSPSPQCS